MKPLLTALFAVDHNRRHFEKQTQYTSRSTHCIVHASKVNKYEEVIATLEFFHKVQGSFTESSR